MFQTTKQVSILFYIILETLCVSGSLWSFFPLGKMSYGPTLLCASQFLAIRENFTMVYGRYNYSIHGGYSGL